MFDSDNEFKITIIIWNFWLYLYPFRWRIFPSYRINDRGDYNHLYIEWLCFITDGIIYLNKKGRDGVKYRKSLKDGKNK